MVVVVEAPIQEGGSGGGSSGSCDRGRPVEQASRGRVMKPSTVTTTTIIIILLLVLLLLV